MKGKALPKAGESLEDNSYSAQQKRKSAKAAREQKQALEAERRAEEDAALLRRHFRLPPLPLDRSMLIPADVRQGSDPDWLEWRDVWDEEHCRRQPYTPDCLREFLTLHGEKNEEILAFAKKWGPLGVFPQAVEGLPNFQCDSYAAWRILSRRLQGYMTNGTKLGAGTEPEPAEWEQVPMPKEAVNPHSLPLYWQKVVFAKSLSALLRPLQLSVGFTIWEKNWLQPHLSVTRHPVQPPAPMTAEELLWVFSSTSPFGAQFEEPPRAARPSYLYSALLLHLAAVLSIPARNYLCGQCGEGTFAIQRMPRKNTTPLCTNRDCIKTQHREKSLASANKRRKANQPTKNALPPAEGKA